MSHVARCVLVLAVCLTAALPQAQADTIFSDGSENSTVGVIPDANDPTIGTWNFEGNYGVVETKTGFIRGGPAGASSGSNYVLIGRDYDDGLPPHGVANVGAEFDRSVHTTTYGLHTEFQYWMRGGVYQNNAFGLLYSPPEAFDESHIWLTTSNYQAVFLIGDLIGDGLTTNVDVYYFDVTIPNSEYPGIMGEFIDTGLDVINRAWNLVAIDSNPVTGKVTIDINGGTPFEVPAQALGGATLVRRLQIFPAGGGNKAYYDDFLAESPQPIPEPTTLVLLTFGLIGLLAYAWRKQE